MKVCYFYTDEHPRALAALPTDAELVYTGGSRTAYWEAFSERWGQGDTLVTIEHDIVIREDVIPSFAACDELWCDFQYFCGPMVGKQTRGAPLWNINLLSEGLGCAKFSVEAQELVTVDDMLRESSIPTNTCSLCGQGQGIQPICWSHLDIVVHTSFMHKGVAPHDHHPFVEHLHYQGV